MDKFVGKRIDGRYEIQEIIGVGGMAVVYKARDNQENRTVAVKILKEEFTSNEEFLRRFKNESKAIAMLSHPNIVNVYDVSFGDLIQYIVMEYIEGITLKEYIEREGSLRWKDAVYFTTQILKGLQHAHDKGIVHRDVKPQNIMVLADGTIKVTDFGIARFARSDQRTITDKAIGSVHYISPEQARGEKTDEKADIYSVGVMLYEMLTGKLPFQADSAVSVAIMQLQRDPQLPTEINGSIPQGLEQITMHAMQKTLERRYQSAAEMLCDLVQFKKDPAITFDYPYFVDNSPTKFVSSIGDNEEDTIKPHTEEQKEKSSIIPILAGVATTLLITLVVLGIIFIPRLFSDTGAEIECPDFIGMQYKDVVESDVYTDDFDFELKWNIDEEYDYGEVYKQSVTPGKKVKSGAKIIIYVSKGPSTVKVPDVYEMTSLEAKSQLELEGFKVKLTEITDDEIPEGVVIKTDPKRTTVVASGTEITVYISKGKPQKMVEVPDVINFKKAAAEKKINDAGLVAVVEEVYLNLSESEESLGVVNKQEKSGESVLEGSEVKIYVPVGYKYDIELDFTKLTGLTKGLYDIRLWSGDAELTEFATEVDTNKKKNHIFSNVTTTAETTEYEIRIYSGSDFLMSIPAKAVVGKQNPTVDYDNVVTD